MSVYDNFAPEFDKTRHSLWPSVVSFLNSIPPQSTILDVGCGNGKYLSVRKNDCVMHGCDTSIELINIAREKHGHAHIIEANGCKLPYKNKSFDAVICIAVLHHISTNKDRQLFIDELMRVAKPNGKILVSVWATEAKKPTWTESDNGMMMVPWRSKFIRFYHLYTKDEAQSIFDDPDNIFFECNNWYVEKHK